MSPANELICFLETHPDPQIVMGIDYRILAANAAYRRVYAGERNVVGQFCYAISHGYSRPCDECGESCPLAASRVSGEPRRVLHLHHTPRGEEHVDVELTPIIGTSGKVEYFVERMLTVREASSFPAESGMVGKSPAFNRMLELVRRVVPSDTAALLLGESGTGKELVAQAIHQQSRREHGPFVVVECSGLTETLFESELFGYEKGAFTGASQRKIGLVESASGGTLFLDEVGDIPLSLQVKLLRLLETGTFRRVGGVETLRADFRLIAATHRDLKAMVERGSFRRDLYYRLSVFPIHLPALRTARRHRPPCRDAAGAAGAGAGLHAERGRTDPATGLQIPGQHPRTTQHHRTRDADGRRRYPAGGASAARTEKRRGRHAGRGRHRAAGDGGTALSAMGAGAPWRRPQVAGCAVGDQRTDALPETGPVTRVTGPGYFAGGF